MTAIKSIAVAFLTKPIDEVALIAGVERALDLNRTYRKEHAHRSGEQQVLPLLASGATEQAACWRIKDHQKRCAIAPWNIMPNMEADSFAALVKIVGEPKF